MVGVAYTVLVTWFGLLDCFSSQRTKNIWPFWGLRASFFASSWGLVGKELGETVAADVACDLKDAKVLGLAHKKEQGPVYAYTTVLI
jgi:hypothetical protein